MIVAGAAVRLIPARAGKTTGIHSHPGRKPAHPRSRGENYSPHSRGLGAPGSSPLARGKPSRRTLLHAREGLIPARAGKTGGVRLRRLGGSAHPRSRGENRLGAHRRRLALGSSPLARGKQSLFEFFTSDDGLIPARAGKTPTSLSNRHHIPAHPRSRGENLKCAMQSVRDSGSSPLARGKRRSECLDGLTVAAHPRSRGENHGAWT